MHDQSVVEHIEGRRELFPERRPVTTPLDVVRPYLAAVWAAPLQAMPVEAPQTLHL